MAQDCAKETIEYKERPENKADDSNGLGAGSIRNVY
jgi:hypothetical protein